MILFEEDWNKYPTAIVHLHTKNLSFLEYAGLLKEMGVKNHLFMLALVNPELEHIDPFSEELTQGEIFMIVEECRVNPWYYFREIALAPARAGTVNNKFRANRGSISVLWLYFNHITVFLMQPRQTGKSFTIDTLMNGLSVVLTVNNKFNLLTTTNKLRLETVERIKKAYKVLPWYLKLRTNKDTANTEKLTVNALGNVYITNVSQMSKTAALDTGRGMAFTTNHVDEISYIKNLKITLPAMLASGGDIKDQAAKNGEHYGDIYTSTAGHLNSESGAYAYKILNDGAKWSEVFYDCQDIKKLTKLIKINSRNKEKLLVSCVFNHRQLGKTDAWVAKKMSDASAEGQDAEADFLNRWGTGNVGSPVPKEYHDIIHSTTRDDYYTEISDYGYVTRWFVKEINIDRLKDRNIVLGIDTSDASGGDDIGIVLRDIKSGRVLAAGNYNETNLIAFSEWLGEWIVRFPKLTIIMEKKSSAQSILDNLFRILPKYDIDPFLRIFNWKIDNIDNDKEFANILNDPVSYRSQRVYEKYKGDFGFATTGSGKQSRDKLYGSNFIANIKYTGDRMYDPVLIDQIMSLTIKNSRIDHDPGKHDDLVIAWMLTYFFMKEANNVDKYGITKKNILSDIVNTIDGESNPEVLKKIKEQENIKREILKLVEEVKGCVGLLRTKKINSAKFLYKSLDKSIIKSTSIDSVLENIDIVNKQNTPLSLVA